MIVIYSNKEIFTILLLVIFLLFSFGCTSTENSTVATFETSEDFENSASSSLQKPSSFNSSSQLISSQSYSSIDGTSSSSSSSINQTFDSVSSWIYSDSGYCSGICDSSEPVFPEIYSWVATGNITTYGSITDPQPSRGGACNFGETDIMQFAAINVHIEPGDNRGQWQNGEICGQCVKVRARTNEGWKQTVVRIVDKCPDDNCGIDLGGTATEEIMGNIPGRYSGEWRFVDCPKTDLITDGVAHIYVKDGSSIWWSLIQVRNPKSAVVSIFWKYLESSDSVYLPRAVEAENFFSVPTHIMEDNITGTLLIEYNDGEVQSVEINSRELSLEYNEIEL